MPVLAELSLNYAEISDEKSVHLTPLRVEKRALSLITGLSVQIQDREFLGTPDSARIAPVQLEQVT